MRTFFRLLLVAIIGLAGYLTLWPVVVEPLAWEPTKDPGFTGPFAANERLAAAAILPIGGRHGPEDVAVGPDGKVYFSTHGGWIMRMGADGKAEDWVRIDGRPLGIEFDRWGNLIVADAYQGLVSVGKDKSIRILTAKVGQSPIRYADDLDIAPDGTIYFSDATTRYSAKDGDGTLGASLLDLLEHQKTGRLLAYTPTTNTTTVVADGFSFANGVALSADGSFVLLNETGEYRIWRIWLSGVNAGKQDIFADALPGFPDNIQRDADGRFWVGLASPRRAIVDQLAPSPFLRKVINRLPKAIQPAPKPYGILLAYDVDGKLLANLQDPAGSYPVVTGAVAHDGKLYVSSLVAPGLAVLPLDKAGL